MPSKDKKRFKPSSVLKYVKPTVSMGTWLTNAGKSIGVSALDVIRSTVPATIENIENAAELVQDFRQELTDMKAVEGRVSNALDLAFWKDTVSGGAKDALDSIRTGNLYKSPFDFNDDDFGDFEGFDGFDDDFEFDENFDTETVSEDGTTSVTTRHTKGQDVDVNQVNVNVDIGEDSALVRATNTQTEVSAELAQTHVETVKKSTQILDTSIYQLRQELSGALHSMDSNIASIASVTSSIGQSSALAMQYYNDSMGVFNSILEAINGIKEGAAGNLMGAAEAPKEYADALDMFSGNGVLDLKQYGQLVAKQFSSAMDSNVFTVFIKGILQDKDTIAEALKHPMNAVVDSLVGKVIPSILRESAKKFDDTLKEFAITGLSQIGALENSDNEIYRLLGMTFGVKNKLKKEVDKANYKRGKVDWDGQSHKTLNEVIPYYLRKITSALTGEREVGFDYETGRFRTVKEMVDEYEQKDRQRMLSQHSMLLSDFNNYINSFYQFTNTKDSEKLNKYMGDFIYRMVNSPSVMRRKKLEGYDKNSFAESIARKMDSRLDDDTVKVVASFFDNLSNQEVMNAFGRNILDARAQMSNYKNREEMGEVLTNGVYVNNGTTVDPLYDKDTGKTQYSKATSYLIDRDKYGNTPVYYQREILKLLATGIRVYPQTIANGIGGTPTSDMPTKAWDDIFKAYERQENENRDEEAKIRKYKNGESIDRERVENGVKRGKVKLDIRGLDSISQFNADAAASEWFAKRDKEREDEMGNSVSFLDKLAGKDNSLGKIISKFTEYMKKPTKILTDMFEKADNFLFSIIFGGEGGPGGSVFKRAIDFMKKQFKTFGTWLNDKIFTPLHDALFGDDGLFNQIKQSQMWQDAKEFFGNMKTKLFGEKDEDDNYVGGFFSDFATDLSQIGGQVKEFFIGKDENSVLSHLKSAGKAVFDNIASKFGYDAEASRAKTEETGKGPITRMLDSISSTVKERVNTTMDSILGPKDPENQRREIVEMLQDDVRGKGSKFAAGTVVGILGSFFTPFGPIGGALLGLGTTLVKESEGLKQLFFGKRDLETGERQGGWVSKEIIDMYNENKTGIKFGLLAGLVSKFGLIPSFILPGGPIGGALLGGAASIVWHLDSVQRFMYGYDGEDGEHVDGFFDKLKNAFGEDYKKLGIDAGIGAGVGALGGLLLPTGPLLGAVLGASAGIALQSEKVKDFIFGEADEKGIRSGGLISKITETITGPIRKSFALAQVKFVGWLERRVISPLATAFAPIIDEGKRIVQNIKDGIKNIVDNITTSVNNTIIKPVKEAFKTLFQPAIDATKKITNGFLKVIGGILTSPIKVLQLLGYGLNRKHMKEGERGYFDQTIGNAFTISRKKRKKMGLSETASFWERLSSFGEFFGGFVNGKHKNAKFSDEYGGAGYAAEFNGKKLTSKQQHKLQVKESEAWQKYKEEIIKNDPKHTFTKEERADFDKKHNLYSGLWKKTAKKGDDSKIDINSADITAQNININSKALGDLSDYLQQIGSNSPYKKYKEAMRKKGLFVQNETDWMQNAYDNAKEQANQLDGILPDIDKLVTSSLAGLSKNQKESLLKALQKDRKAEMFKAYKESKSGVSNESNGKFDTKKWKEKFDKENGGFKSHLQEMDITAENMKKIKGQKAPGGLVPSTGAYILNKGEYVIPSDKKKEDAVKEENKFFNNAKKKANAEEEKKQEKFFNRIFSNFKKKDKTQEAKEKAVQEEADELKKTQAAGSYETKAKIAEEKAKESKLQKWRDDILGKIGEMKDSAFEHFERWKEIFGPKGKIALAILALSPIVAGIADIVRKMLDGMNFGEAVKEYFGEIGEKYFGPNTFLGRMISRIKQCMEPLPAIWDNIKETGKAFGNIFAGKDGNFFTRLRDFIFPKNEKGENQYTGKSDVIVNAGMLAGNRLIQKGAKAGKNALGDAIEQAIKYEETGNLKYYNWINQYDDGLDIFHKIGSGVKEGVTKAKTFVGNQLYGSVDNKYVLDAMNSAMEEAISKGEEFDVDAWKKKYLKKAKKNSRLNNSIFDKVKDWKLKKKQRKIDKINSKPKSLKYKLRNNKVSKAARNKYQDFKDFMTRDLIFDTDEYGRRAASTISQNDFKYFTDKATGGIKKTFKGYDTTQEIIGTGGQKATWHTDGVFDKVKNKVKDVVYGKEKYVDQYVIDTSSLDNMLGSADDLVIDTTMQKVKKRQGGLANTKWGKKIFKTADKVDDVLAKGAASNVDDVVKSPSFVSKVSKCVKDCLGALKGAIDTVIGKFVKGKPKGRFASKLSSFLDDALKLFTKGGKAIAKYGQKILGAVAKGAAVVTVAWGVISGPAGAANLFGVREDEVDTKMKVISTIWNTMQTFSLPGVPVGAIAAVIEVVSEVVAEFTGVNFVREVSTLLYGVISSEDDRVNLQNAQDKFMNEYQTMLNSSTYEEYQQSAKAQGFKNVLSEKEWNKSKEMNFEEFNDNQNKTLGKKLADKMGGVKKIGKKVDAFAKKAYKDVRQTHLTDLFRQDYWEVKTQKADGSLKTEEELMREKIGKVLNVPLHLVKSVFNFHIEAFDTIIKGFDQTVKDFKENSKTALDAIKDGTSVFKETYWQAPKTDNQTDAGNLTTIAFYLNRILLFVPGIIIGIGKSIGRGLDDLIGKVKEGWNDVISSFKFSDITSTSDIFKDGNYWKAPEDDAGNPISPLRRAIFYASKLVLFVPAVVVGMVKDLGRALDPVIEPIKKVAGPFMEKLKGLFTKDGKDPGPPKGKGVNHVMYWTARILGFVPKVVTGLFNLASEALTPVFKGFGVMATSIFTGMEQLMGTNIKNVFTREYWTYNPKNEGHTKELNGFEYVMFYTGRILALPIWAMTWTIQKVVALTGPIITSLVGAVANIVTQTQAAFKHGSVSVFSNEYWDIKNPTKGEFSDFEKIIIYGFKVLTLPIFAVVGIIRDISKGINPLVKNTAIINGFFKNAVRESQSVAIQKGLGGVFNRNYWSFKEDKNDSFSGLKKIIFYTTRIGNFLPNAILAAGCDIARVIVATVKGINDINQFATLVNIETFVKASKKGIMSVFSKDYWNPEIKDSDPLSGIKKIIFYTQKMATFIPASVVGLASDVARGVKSLVKGIFDVGTYTARVITTAGMIGAKEGTKAVFTSTYWKHGVSEDDKWGGLKKILFWANRIMLIPQTTIMGLFADTSKLIKTVIDNITQIKDDWAFDVNNAFNMIDMAGVVALFRKEYWQAKDDSGNKFSGLRKIMFWANRILTLPVMATIGVFTGVRNAYIIIIETIKKSLKEIDEMKEVDTSISWDDYWNKDRPKNTKGFGVLSLIAFWVSRVVYSPILYVKKLMDKISNPMGKVVDSVKDFFGLGGDGDFEESGGNGDIKSNKPKATKKPAGGFGTTIPDIQNGFPYYSQNDENLKNKPYRLSKRKDKEESPDVPETMGNRGCGPTAMAMVASNVMGGNGDNPYSPENMAKLATKGNYSTNAGTTPGYFTGVGTKLGMNVTPAVATAKNINSMLRKGDPVIIQGASDDPNTPYTSSGHYVVAVGLDRDGNVIVNDPRGREYSKAYSMKDIQKGSARAWGFSKGISKVGTTGSHLSGSKPSRVLRLKGGNGASWIGVVRVVKEAVAAQRPGYSQSRYITINVNGTSLKVRTDCSGLVSACLALYGAIPTNKVYTSAGLLKKNDDTLMKSGMFTPIDFPGWENLKEGDILVVNGHTEIFSRNDGDKHYVYNAGSTSSINNPGETRSSRAKYTMIWRCNGAGAVDTDTGVIATGKTGFISAMTQLADAMVSPVKRLLYGEEATDSTMSSDGTVNGVVPNSGADGNYSSNYSGNAAFPFSSTNATKNAFVPKILAKSVQSGAQYGIYPSIKLSQAAVESRWGQSGLATKGNNLFGIKAGESWKGATINMRTGEQTESGSKYMTSANFRKYSSWDESIDDHSQVLAKSLYNPVRNSKNFVEAANQLQKCGYATAHDYANTLISTIKANNFSYYDRPEAQTEFLGSPSTSVDGNTGGSYSDSSSSSSSSSTGGKNSKKNSNKNGTSSSSSGKKPDSVKYKDYFRVEYDELGSNGMTHKKVAVKKSNLDYYRLNRQRFLNLQIYPISKAEYDKIKKGSNDRVATASSAPYRKVIFRKYAYDSRGKYLDKTQYVSIMHASQVNKFKKNPDVKVVSVALATPYEYEKQQKEAKKFYLKNTGVAFAYKHYKKYKDYIKDDIKKNLSDYWDEVKANVGRAFGKGGKGGYGEIGVKPPKNNVQITPPKTPTGGNGDVLGGFGDTGSYTASNIPKIKTPTTPTVSTQTYKPTQQSYKPNTNYTQIQRTLDNAERLSRETAAYDDANVVSGINELINGMQMLVTEMRGTNAGVNKFNDKELVVNSTPVVYSPTTNNIAAPQQPQQQQKNVQKSSFLDQASYTMARNIASGGL